MIFEIFPKLIRCISPLFPYTRNWSLPLQRSQFSFRKLCDPLMINIFYTFIKISDGWKMFRQF